MRKDMDDTNNLTMNHHKYATQYSLHQKKADGKFNNSYAHEAMRGAVAFGAANSTFQSSHSGGPKKHDPAGLTFVNDPRKATGVTKVSPDRLTT